MLLDHQDTWLLSHSPLCRERMSSCFLMSVITLATKYNIGFNKWWLAIWKNSVPQQGIEHWSLTIWVSIIPLAHQDTWSLSHYHKLKKNRIYEKITILIPFLQQVNMSDVKEVKMRKDGSNFIFFLCQPIRFWRKAKLSSLTEIKKIFLGIF